MNRPLDRGSPAHFQSLKPGFPQAHSTGRQDVEIQSSVVDMDNFYSVAQAPAKVSFSYFTILKLAADLLCRQKKLIQADSGLIIHKNIFFYRH
jgi:hypothetical protein